MFIIEKSGTQTKSAITKTATITLRITLLVLPNFEIILNFSKEKKFSLFFLDRCLGEVKVLEERVVLEGRKEIKRRNT